ncbi:MAG: CoA transferase [Betaproteobacteria bacterium]|jgi:crotonobetainyl-CoA:carnitine CoA-transferase CaiB-like acyl-CoA transferase|nr:CoA transferase [Betaproteobacteria bacterium]
MKKILDGMVVLDLTRFFSGPQCTLFLAGMGAEVIKIDDPKGGDPIAFAPPFDGPEGISLQKKTDKDMGLAYLKRARGKKSVTLDLKSAEGLAIFMEMVKKADVVVENFRAGVSTRLGVDYPALCAVNPKIIYCALTGYGSTGPAKDDKAYDLMVQAAVGLMSMTGQPGEPPVKTASALSDAISGVFAAHGIVAALLHRERTGEGQAIDVAMADCLFSLIFDEPFDTYERLNLAQRQGNRIMRFSPFNIFQARDGWVALGAATHEEWLSLLDAMGRADLKADPDMMQIGWRIVNNDQVDAVVTQWTSTRTKAEIVEALFAASVACSPVRTADEVMQWPQLLEREMIVRLKNPLTGKDAAASGPGFPIKFSLTPGSYDTPSPLPGAHSEEVFGRLANLSAADVQRLKGSGII